MVSYEKANSANRSSARKTFVSSFFAYMHSYTTCFNSVASGFLGWTCNFL